MNTAAGEWAARVAARNEIETAKAMGVGAIDLSRRGAEMQRDIRLLPLSADGASALADARSVAASAGDKGTV